MEHKCFSCGTPLSRLLNCIVEAYICKGCRKIYFNQEYRIICPVCGCHYETKHELVGLKDYRPRGFQEVKIKCASCSYGYNYEG